MEAAEAPSAPPPKAMPKPKAPLNPSQTLAKGGPPKGPPKGAPRGPPSPKEAPAAGGPPKGPPAAGGPPKVAPAAPSRGDSREGGKETAAAAAAAAAAAGKGDRGEGKETGDRRQTEEEGTNTKFPNSAIRVLYLRSLDVSEDELTN
ncbi:hypothetical protein EBH_0045220 [Eimeria brunetti]|uniref:Uncharacterized protein n=1 Tax=Eimeria brunetti TaxID=51314 RepID=U6LNX4_9EIME|nr:hypothetical protein EBH_0045220 [Eimeria brunetti]